MTDVRQQLTEALDRTEREFKHEHTWTCAITAEDGPSCDCGLSDLMARLVERDRALLADVAVVEQQQRENAAELVRVWQGAGLLRLREHAERIGGRLDALLAEVERAAAFWVGTPEVDR